MPLEFKLENSSIGTLKVDRFANSYILDYPCEDKTICTNYIVKLTPNKYLFEAWGAEGGENGGSGGYSRGILIIRKTTNAKIFIGAKGPTISRKSGMTKAAFNGGGAGSSGGNQRAAGSGGGATDLRIGNTLNDRIFVAGAGGGGDTQLDSNSKYLGGDGGGIDGKIGTKYSGTDAKGGTQTEPGIGQEDYGGTALYKTKSGIFGYGGQGALGGTCGGGGGGWFGGASGAPYCAAGGGGGSGYILSSKSFKPINYSHNSSKYWFLTGSTKDGGTTFSSCYSNDRETGHKGDGCFRITIIDSYTNKVLSYPIFHYFLLIILIRS